MPEDTKADAGKTSEGDGKNSEEGKAEGAGTQTATAGDAPKFTQADLDRIAAKTREEERRKAKEAREREDREREEAKAKEQGEFQKLAEGYKAELEALKPQHEAASAELAQYRSKAAEIAAQELKALPEEVRDISPAVYGDDKALTNPLDVLSWLPKGKKLAEKLSGQTAKPGAGPDPKPKGSPGDGEAGRAAIAGAVRSTF